MGFASGVYFGKFLHDVVSDCQEDVLWLTRIRPHLSRFLKGEADGTLFVILRKIGFQNLNFYFAVKHTFGSEYFNFFFGFFCFFYLNLPKFIFNGLN